jgi:hypothetical protein
MRKKRNSGTTTRQVTKIPVKSVEAEEVPV